MEPVIRKSRANTRSGMDTFRVEANDARYYECRETRKPRVRYAKKKQISAAAFSESLNISQGTSKITVSCLVSRGICDLAANSTYVNEERELLVRPPFTPEKRDHNLFPRDYPPKVKVEMYAPGSSTDRNQEYDHNACFYHKRLIW